MPNAPVQPLFEPPGGPNGKARWLRPAILLLLLAVFAALLLSGTGPVEMLAWLRDSHGVTRGLVDEHRLIAALVSTLVYIVLASLALPGALWLTIAAGFLLGPVWAVPVSLGGLTIGALNTVVLVRYIAGTARRARLRARYHRIANGFERHQLSYVILLRLLPLPYFGVNLAAGLSGVRWWPFTLGTMIGSLPAIILYAGFGAGLGSIAEMDGWPGPASLLQPAVLIPLAMIIPLAAAPILWRRWRRRGKADALPGESR